MGGTRVLIIDDHPVVTEGLAACLEATGDLSVCGIAHTAAEAERKVDELSPDVAVVDLRLPDRDGLHLVKDLAAKIPVLVLSMHDERDFGPRVISLGAGGYVMKAEPAESVLEAIRLVARGGRHLSPAVLERMREGAAGKSSRSRMDQLTHRELEVFELIGRGMTTKRIADRLGVAPKTVETYRENIKGKLDLENAVELVRAAVLWVEGLGPSASGPAGTAPVP
jgi:DNA-binding NarL/FixJ family response regulator